MYNYAVYASDLFHILPLFVSFTDIIPYSAPFFKGQKLPLAAGKATAHAVRSFLCGAVVQAERGGNLGHLPPPRAICNELFLLYHRSHFPSILKIFYCALCPNSTNFRSGSHHFIDNGINKAGHYIDRWAIGNRNVFGMARSRNEYFQTGRYLSDPNTGALFRHSNDRETPWQKTVHGRDRKHSPGCLSAPRHRLPQYLSRKRAQSCRTMQGNCRAPI